MVTWRCAEELIENGNGVLGRAAGSGIGLALGLGVDLDLLQAGRQTPDVRRYEVGATLMIPIRREESSHNLAFASHTDCPRCGLDVSSSSPQRYLVLQVSAMRLRRRNRAETGRIRPGRLLVHIPRLASGDESGA